MTTLSTHVLDIERGAPAAGVPIALYRGEQRLTLAETNADGRVADLSGGSSLEAGSYRLVFDVAAYFGRQGRTAGFLQRVSIEFQVDAADPHYHVPLLLSPYACTSYRGS
jgi:5-hydroxyisourate hydrolase